MGAVNDKDKKLKGDLEQISFHSPHYDRKQKQELLKQFRKEMGSPTGDPIISKKDFTEMMKTMSIHDPLLQDIIFNAFDTNRDGLLSFQEFVLGLSVLNHGTPDEKLTCKCTPGGRLTDVRSQLCDVRPGRGRVGEPGGPASDHFFVLPGLRAFDLPQWD
uniref:EF-hand domain-containing protein n=1 Tax=Arcella intermedia TaxID=1963864 RepID=A0A6B2LNU5_9EUKA